MFSNKALKSTTNQLSNPAKYRHVVVFEEFGREQNDEGHRIESWETSSLGTTYAQIRNIRGNEYIMAGAEQAKVSARINIRYRKDVVETDQKSGSKLRLNFNGRIFEIVYINNLEEKNIELELIVNEVR